MISYIEYNLLTNGIHHAVDLVSGILGEAKILEVDVHENSFFSGFILYLLQVVNPDSLELRK